MTIAVQENERKSKLESLAERIAAVQEKRRGRAKAKARDKAKKNAEHYAKTRISREALERRAKYGEQENVIRLQDERVKYREKFLTRDVNLEQRERYKTRREREYRIRLLTLLQNRPEVFTPFVKPEKVRKPKPKKEPIVRPVGPAYRPVTQREVAYAVALTKKKNQFLFVFSMNGEQIFECVASRPSYALDVFHIEMPHLAHLAKLNYGTREIDTTKPLSVFQHVRFYRELVREHARRAHHEILFTFELKNGPGRTPTSVMNKKYFQCIAYDDTKAGNVLMTELVPRPLDWTLVRKEDVTDKFIVRTLKPTAEGNWL